MTIPFGGFCLHIHLIYFQIRSQFMSFSQPVHLLFAINRVNKAIRCDGFKNKSCKHPPKTEQLYSTVYIQAQNVKRDFFPAI